MRRLTVIILLVVIGLGASPSSAQDGTPTFEPGACEQIVQDALDFIRDSCAGLGIGEACFGSEEDSLDGLSTLPTDPSSKYRVAALRAAGENSPLVMVLVGEAALNLTDVTPITVTVVVVDATANSNANLRGSPSTDGAVVGNVNAGEALELVGMNQAGDWFQVLRPDGSYAWIYGPLITVTDPTDLPDLPITGETPPGSVPDTPKVPSVGLRFGSTPSACPEAATGLVLQSADGTPVSFTLNNLLVKLDGAAIITQLQGGPGNDIIRLTTLVNGEISITSEGQPFTANQPGTTFGAETLDDNIDRLFSNVTLASDWTGLEGLATENAIQVCENAVQTGLIQLEGDQGCDTVVVTFAQDDPALVAHKQQTDAEMDVLVCDTSQPVTGSDATYADILNISAVPTESGYSLDVILAAPPADALANAFSFALVAWLRDANGNSNAGLLLQVHEGVQTIGQIDRNFIVVPGTNNLIATDSDSATFTLPPDVTGFDLQAFLMNTAASSRVCDTTEFMTLP